MELAHQSNSCLVEDVVILICKSLSVKDIKNARLVSKVWNCGASYRLKELTRLHVDFNPRNLDISLIKEQLNFFPHHVCILLRGMTRIKAAMFSPELVPSGLNLRSLWISGCPRNKWDDLVVTLVGEMLANSSSSLEEVKYYGYIRPKFGEGVVFKKVKKLRVYSLQLRELSHICRIFLNTCPNLERLEMDYAGNNLWVRDPARFPSSLTSLIFNSVYLQEAWIGKNFAKQLYLNFPNPLRVLHLSQYCDEPEMHMSLYDLLQKHASTLVELGVTLKAYHRDLYLPPLPVLEFLEINVGRDHELWWLEEDEQGVDRETLGYAKFLPKLSRLHLMCGQHVDSTSLVDSFIPVDPNELEDYAGPGCRTVKNVVIRENLVDPARLKDRFEQYCYLCRVWPEAEIKWDTFP